MSKRKMRKWEKETRAKRDEKENSFHTYFKTGVFEMKVNGITVGYFVGWRYCWSERARNIRKGLFFDTPEAAIAFRDSLEKTRDMVDEQQQIA